MPRWLLVVLLTLGGSIACLLAAFLYVIGAHCVSPFKLTRIHQGQSTDEVVAILGRPVRMIPLSEGRTALRYSDPWLYCIVNVYVDSSRHVLWVYHDH